MEAVVPTSGGGGCARSSAEATSLGVGADAADDVVGGDEDSLSRNSSKNDRLIAVTNELYVAEIRHERRIAAALA
jgi:hypothetical protein